VVVSRKVGGAVVRNRVRRRLREAMLALVRARFGGPGAASGRTVPWPPSFDVLVIARPSAAQASYADLAAGLATAVDRAWSGAPRAARDEAAAT